MLDGQLAQSFMVKPKIVIGKATPSDDLLDRDLRLRIPMKAGSHEIGVTFPKDPWLLLETEREPYLAFFSRDRQPRILPALYSITVTGPFDPTGAGDTVSRRRIFVCRPANPSEEESCAKKVLSTFARRAYRRPVTDADLQTPLKYYQDGRTAGGFDAGIERGLRYLLVSPEFLFRIEKDPANLAPNTPYRLTDL